MDQRFRITGRQDVMDAVTACAISDNVGTQLTGPPVIAVLKTAYPVGGNTKVACQPDAVMTLRTADQAKGLSIFFLCPYSVDAVTVGTVWRLVIAPRERRSVNTFTKLRRDLTVTPPARSGNIEL